MTQRSSIKPISVTIPDQRQRFARHYGVHPYFTRRSANVIQAYIERYSTAGDVVFDPFGGSGVTAIEAMLMGRKAIHNDLNPFANFLTSVIADTTLPSTKPLTESFERVEKACRDELLAIESLPEKEISERLRDESLPENIQLPANSDAKFFYDLFTPRQLLGLSRLKHAIDEEQEASVRNPLLLAWSAAMAKLNKTFISAKGRAESRGGSSIFSIYRYKLAKIPVELPLWKTFKGRFLNILSAKEEILTLRDYAQCCNKSGIDSRENLTILQDDAARLSDRLGEEIVDYIFTDPPYGAYISYLDLSILWNHWLGFDVTARMRQEEIIVGGEQKLSEEHYRRKLAESIRTCVRLLKPDRWFSVVFQHWDIRYFEAILRTAATEGAELRSAVTQERDVIWSMHKKKNSESLLAGEMILTFYKPPRFDVACSGVREPNSCLLGDLLDEVLRQEAQSGELTSQRIFNKLVLCAWQRDSLAELSVSREAFAAELRARGWDYDARRHVWRKLGQRQQSLFDTRQKDYLSGSVKSSKVVKAKS